MGRPILLDVDADFMLDGDYNPDWGFPKGRSKIAVSGKQLGNTLRHFRKRDTEIVFEVDHHESLYWWDCFDIHNAFCIHIDAHHDMWINDGIRKEFRDKVDCGNFLNQALHDRVVDRVLFVPACFREVKHQRKDIKHNIKRATNKVRVESWGIFKKKCKTYPKADVITICVSPEWFPKKHWQEVVDLATILGVGAEQIEAIRKRANRKWKLGYRGWTKDFRFPYEKTESSVLQQLRQTLHVVGPEVMVKYLDKGHILINEGI